VRNSAAQFLSADLPYRDGRLAVIDSTLAVCIDGERCDGGSDPGDLTLYSIVGSLRNFVGLKIGDNRAVIANRFGVPLSGMPSTTGKAFCLH